MESNDIAIKTKLASAIHQLSDGIIENQASYQESLTCASKPNIQLLELADNIQAAESNYNNIKEQWDYMKSRHRAEIHNQHKSELLQESISSFGSLRIDVPEDPIKRDERDQDAENNDECCNAQEESTLDDVRAQNQVQVVLTPRSQNSDSQNHEKIVPNLDIRVGESLESIKTNKRPKKIYKSKKKAHVSRVNEDMLKTSLIYTSGTSKRKKIYGRLRNSNSKSTIATRETNVSDKKGDRRKFKRQRSLDGLSMFQTPQFRKRTIPFKTRECKPLKSKDFVEIYHNHNATLKSGSLSVVSSRQSKTRPATNPQIRKERSRAVGDNTNNKNDIPVIDQYIENITRLDSERTNLQENIENFHKKDDHSQVHEERMKNCSSDFYDPFCQRNYEMPTTASKMKRVHRPYYHSFNIRNIPFIVGTSISPSHNLGLNIQQVLSIIKVRQPTIPGISSLLIRKVSKGMRPVSTLFEEINNEFARSCRNLNYPDASRGERSKLRFNQDMGSFSCEHLRGSNMTSSITHQATFKQNFTCEPLYEEDEESRSTCSEFRVKSQIMREKQSCYEAPVGLDNFTNKSAGSRQRTQEYPRKHGQESSEDDVRDSMTGNKSNYQSNNKEMSEVFTRLYEQFNKMIMQQDKLKAQSEKHKDKSLAKEVSEMEVAIREKEKEITAVVNLYKEVMSLKQQMKHLHERNSFVCISAEDPAMNRAARSRSRTAESLGCESRSRCNVTGVHRTSSNALKLAGLLRQIQAFQRQLALA